MALYRRWASAEKVGGGARGSLHPEPCLGCCHCPILALCLPLLKVPSGLSFYTLSLCDLIQFLDCKSKLS